MKVLAFALALALLALGGCGDPESIVQPYAAQIVYEFTEAEVSDAGGWLFIAELGNDSALDLTPAVYIWGMRLVDDTDQWNQIAEENWRLDLLGGRLFIDPADENELYRVIVARKSSEL